jgi:hypothetical protein
MATYNQGYLRDAHKCSIFHQSQIMQSEVCGCFYCMSTFSPREIKEWTDIDSPLGATALCPQCGIDSVIGSASGFPIDDNDFLIQMNKYWF